jgi:surface polysaccharide O-acyltransferase-like enzyme
VLLVFDAVAAGLYLLRQRWAANARAARNVGVYGGPAAYVAALVIVSAVVYVPMEFAFGADRWLILGPFSFQASRLVLYAIYFLVGIQIGASGAEPGFLARNAGLARRWPIWLAACLAAYALRLAVVIALVLPIAVAHRPLPLSLRLLSDVAFVLCCGTISFAFIALFRRFAIARHPVLDSLSVSSYGIYLIHYPVVVWLQFALLTVGLGPVIKGAMVFAGAVALSWGIVVGLRRAPVIARLL